MVPPHSRFPKSLSLKKLEVPSKSATAVSCKIQTFQPHRLYATSRSETSNKQTYGKMITCSDRHKPQCFKIAPKVSVSTKCTLLGFTRDIIIDKSSLISLGIKWDFLVHFQHCGFRLQTNFACMTNLVCQFRWHGKYISKIPSNLFVWAGLGSKPTVQILERVWLVRLK